MAGKVRALLERFATRRAGFAALAGAVACMAGLAWRGSRLGDLELLDGRLWYTPNEAALLFDALDANARLVYAATALTIDMAFAAAYGLLFSILLFRLFRLFRLPLYLLPLALASADALENVTIAALALSHAGAPTPLASLAAAFTVLKWLLCAATLSATAAGVLNWLRVRIRR